jgi:uncharacterized SAM-binding protein YcdF (DUF218 family)
MYEKLSNGHKSLLGRSHMRKAKPIYSINKISHKVASVAAILAAFFSAVWLISSNAEDLKYAIKETILGKLVHLNPLPPEEVVDAIYVLGSSQRSLLFKYQVAAELYRRHAVDRIWILSRPGRTEYSSEIGRNLTNDEWSIRELKKLGIPEGKIELIKVPGGFFGTFSEAKHISALVRERELKSLLLIAEQYHTKRTYMSFKKYLPTDTTIYVQSPTDSQPLYEMGIEIIKLKIYDTWVLE